MKNKNTKTLKQKSKMIGKGSFGCIYRPEIPCKEDLQKNKKTKKKRSKNKVSKVMLQSTDTEVNKEFSMDNIIQKIPNHKEWAFIWEKLCDPPSYNKMKKLSEINKCLKKFKKTKEDYNKSSYMLIGEYGGIPLLDYCLKFFKKTTFRSLKLFKKSFLRFFRNLEPLFIGLVELSKHNLSHQDLSISNIMYKNKRLYMIDFGLSCRWNDKKSFKKRSLGQLNSSRIYGPYPYDYIHCFATRNELDTELRSFQREIYRNNHDDYLRIHRGIFGRNAIHEDIRNDLSKINKNKINVLKNLDTFSVGILLPTVICDIADHFKISNKQIYKCFSQVDIQNHLSLLKDMTEYNSKNRISPEESYKRYKSLI